MAQLTIDVVSDLVCPWCYIGTRRLDQVLKSMPEATPALVRYRPFLLDSSVPPEGADLRQWLRRKYGADPESMFARVEAQARTTGIPLDFSRVQRYPSTLAAHTLLCHALEKGTQRALADALFTAYFIESKDIGDSATLAQIARDHGFSEEDTLRLVSDAKELEATRAEATALSQQGISGVPFFIFNEQLAFSGAQPPDVFRGAIEEALPRFDPKNKKASSVT